jgi:predicted nucleic acid-binding protein
MAELFIDTNVFVRHLAQDHAEYSPKATAFFARIERGELKAQTAETAIFEAVFTLERRYRAAKSVIREGLLSLIELPGIVVSGKQRLRRVFELYAEHNMSFGDAYHVALMEQLGIEEIATFDRDFDRVPGIRRVEPA